MTDVTGFTAAGAAGGWTAGSTGTWRGCSRTAVTLDDCGEGATLGFWPAFGPTGLSFGFLSAIGLGLGFGFTSAIFAPASARAETLYVVGVGPPTLPALGRGFATGLAETT